MRDILGISNTLYMVNGLITSFVPFSISKSIVELLYWPNFRLVMSCYASRCVLKHILEVSMQCLADFPRYGLRPFIKVCFTLLWVRNIWYSSFYYDRWNSVNVEVTVSIFIFKIFYCSVEKYLQSAFVRTAVWFVMRPSMYLPIKLFPA